MTALDAQALTRKAKAAAPEQTQAVLACWHRAIEHAAKLGETAVGEGAVEIPRTPVSAAARAGAYDQLRAAGFAVWFVNGKVQVAWGESPRPVTADQKAKLLRLFPDLATGRPWATVPVVLEDGRTCEPVLDPQWAAETTRRLRDVEQVCRQIAEHVGVGRLPR